MRAAPRTAASPRRLRIAGSSRGAGGLLDQLLVPPLDRAVALEEVDHVARRVARQLHLDVARIEDQLLEVELAVAEGGLRLGRGGGEGAGQLVRLAHHAHPLAAAALLRLEQDREADLVRHGEGDLRGRHHPLAPRDDGHPGREHRRLRRGLVPHAADRLGRGADEDDPGSLARLGEAVVLGQEAVARVDRVGVR